MNHKLPISIFLLTIILLLALLLRIGIALTFPNIAQSDEIFQTLEQAHRLAYGYGIIPLEFKLGMRSWVLPGILAGIMRLTDWLGEGSSGYLTGVTIFLCLLSLSSVLIGFLWGYQTGGIVAAVLTGITCSVWFELVYFAPKAFTEVVAAHFLLPGVYLGAYGQFLKPRTRFFLAGCFCGSALALRFHLLPAVIFAMVYICRKDWRGRWLPMSAGILGPILAFGALDAFTWSYPFQSFWMNAWVNVVEDKSSEFGVSPWYGYLLPFIKNWSLFLLPIAFLVILGACRSPILAYLGIVIVFSHSFIAHKEYRFIYPALLIAIILAGLGTAELIKRWRPRWSSLQGMVMTVSVCLVLWTSVSAVLASRYGLFKTNNSFSVVWTAPEKIRWTLYSGNLLAFKELSTEETLCGVGLLGIPLYKSGGYTYLHRQVPIFPVEQDTDFNQLLPSFNYFVATTPVPQQQNGYALHKCWGTTCIYKRLGSCIRKTD
jgi:hypothetical protein